MVPTASSAPGRNWASFCLTAGLVLLALGLLSTQLLTVRAGSVDNAPASAPISEGGEALATGHPGRAILDYERARLLAPRLAVVRDGLARARAELNLPLSEPRLAGTSGQILRADQWGWVTLVGLGLGGAGLVAFVWRVVGRGPSRSRSRSGGRSLPRGYGVSSRSRRLRILPWWSRRTQLHSSHRLPMRRNRSARQRAPWSRSSGRTGDYSLISTAGRHGWVRRTGVEMLLPVEGSQS